MNKLEQYFKDKIDWKFFNYLIDKSTYLEDTGEWIVISAIIFSDSDNEYYDIPLFFSDYGLGSGWINDMINVKYMKQIIELYKKFGITYIIGGYTYNLYSFREKIKNKCDVVMKRNSLTVKPKN